MIYPSDFLRERIPLRIQRLSSMAMLLASSTEVSGKLPRGTIVLKQKALVPSDDAIRIKLLSSVSIYIYLPLL